MYSFSPRFDIPGQDPAMKAKTANIICHNCGEAGHKAVACVKLAPNFIKPIESSVSGHVFIPRGMQSTVSFLFTLIYP